MKKILVIDNYDSFTYNLVHYLEDLDCEVEVKRNDQLKLKDVEPYQYIVLSPGPGIPDEDNFFHTGLDFCGGVGIEVRAPATGVVTFAEPLVVRGNAIMIDHGWGVLSGYMHLDEILVSAGDTVEPGQLIGLVGGTGRVTGAHLHWEIWVSGVQVNPVDWLEVTYPEPKPLAEVGE